MVYLQALKINLLIDGMGMPIMYTVNKGERVYYYEKNVVIFRINFFHADRSC